MSDGTIFHATKYRHSRLPDTGRKIAKSGRPVAKLIRVAAEPRKPGRLKGRIRIGPDFEDPLPEEILAVLRGKGE